MLRPTLLKQCLRCGQIKHVHQFPSTKAGYTAARCKNCTEELQRLNKFETISERKMTSIIRRRITYALKRTFNTYRNIDKGNITVIYMLNLFIKQKGRCAITGRKLSLGIEKTSRVDKNALSIDRIDSTKGYIIGNVQFVTYQANIAKGENSNKDLFEFCMDVVNYRLAQATRVVDNVLIKELSNKSNLDRSRPESYGYDTLIMTRSKRTRIRK